MLGYAFLIAVVIAAVIAMAALIKKRVQGSFKRSADIFGHEEQYEPFGVTETTNR